MMASKDFQVREKMGYKLRIFFQTLYFPITRSQTDKCLNLETSARLVHFDISREKFKL